MIFLGAGASAPLKIPIMGKMVEQFEERIEGNEERAFYYEIKEALAESEGSVGNAIAFDLESLLTILEDFSTTKRAVSLASMSFVFHIITELEEGEFVKEARKRYKVKAANLKKQLKNFIFEICMKPILAGIEKSSYKELITYFGPLFTVLNFAQKSDVKKWIFTTNWD